MNNNCANFTTEAILNVLASVIADAQQKLDSPANAANQAGRNNLRCIGPQAEQPRANDKPAHEFELFTHPDYGTIQTTVIDGKPYFKAKSVMRAIGYSYPDYKNIPDSIKIIAPAGDKKDIRRNVTTFIPESGVNCLVARRKVHELNNFSRWITNEVVPQLMHAGAKPANADTKSVHADTKLSNKCGSYCVSYPNSALVEFTHPDFGKVMTTLLDNTVYYRAVDLARMVGYRSISVVTNLPGKIALSMPIDNCSKAIFIPAEGFNAMLDNRKLLRAPAARPFIEWVLEEIPRELKQPTVSMAG